jgi:hypothetical protein
MSIVLQSSGGGSVTIAEPVTASTLTATLPAATGTVMVSGNMPAFSAYNSTDTSLTGTASTKILFATEVFDTNNNFASSTFTPTVAGYYQINAGYQVAGVPQDNQLYIFKNNAVAYQSQEGTAYGQTVSGLVYCNGSTDYIEVFAYVTVTANTTTGAAKTWFNGAMVRAA